MCRVSSSFNQFRLLKSFTYLYTNSEISTRRERFIRISMSVRNWRANLAAELDLVPILAPLVVLHVVLAVVALLDVRKQEKTRYTGKPIWVALIILVSVMGALIYFVLGRED